MATRPRPDLISARGEAGRELAARLAARAELDSLLDALDAEQRRASEDVVRLSAELADLEREAAGGKPVSGSQRTKAEQALAKVRLVHGEPWAERRAGVQAAIRDPRG